MGNAAPLLGQTMLPSAGAGAATGPYAVGDAMGSLGAGRGGRGPYDGRPPAKMMRYDDIGRSLACS